MGEFIRLPTCPIHSNLARDMQAECAGQKIQTIAERAAKRDGYFSPLETDLAKENQRLRAALLAIKERGDCDDSAKAMYQIASAALETETKQGGD
jgi:hypothetical protein